MTFLAVGIGAGLAVVGTTGKLIQGSNAKKRASSAQTIANNNFEREQKAYKNFKFENKFDNLQNTAAGAQNFAANLENFGVGVQDRADNMQNFSSRMQNTAEDLTVNTQQAEFQAQQQQQGLANTMGSLRGAAGGSGIASLAQAMAGQQSQNLQQSSASIGMQESQNAQMAAQQAGQIQQMAAQESSANQSAGLQAAQFSANMSQANQMASVNAQTRNQEMFINQASQNQMQQRQGAMAVQGMNFDRRSTLFGLAGEQVGAANSQMQAARQMTTDAFGGLVSGGMGMMGSAIPGMSGMGGGGAPSSFQPMGGGAPTLNPNYSSPTFGMQTPTPSSSPSMFIPGGFS